MSLNALEQYKEAHQAFERAIAIDPNNPDALLPAAAFLVEYADNDSLETAVLYARRGRDNEKSAARGAELAAIEAEALNGIGRCDEALRAAESALALDSELPHAMVERGVALFELLRFDEAQQALAEGLARDPKNAKAQHYSGLIAERDGRAAEREAVEDVDVVDLAVGAVLQLPTREVVDCDAAQFVGADDGALCAVRGM